MKLGKFRAEGPVAAIFSAMNTDPWCQEYPAVDYETCIICGTCQRYCPVDTVVIRKDQEDCVVFTWDFYKGCGICASERPKAYIKMMPMGGGK